MKRLALALTLVATTAHAAPIIGGTKTQVGDYPAVVLVSVGGGLCTGELIKPDWVLTAGHCVDPGKVGDTRDIAVYYDTVDVSMNMSHVAHATATVFDPQFNLDAPGSHDLGLIHLSAPITDITPLPVNLFASQAPIGIPVTMVGFGTIEQGAGGGAGVEYVLLNRTSTACAPYDSMFADMNGDPANFLDSNIMCYSQSDGKGKCNGDSGGPSLAMIGGKQTIIATTSFGDNNCAVVGVDTRVDAEKTWLLSQIPDLQCSVDADCDDQTCFEGQCIATPFSDTGIGDECTTGSDCQSGSCVDGSDGMRCSMSCTDTCPEDFTCAANACYPTKIPDGGGCCDAGGAGGATTMLAGLGVVLAGWRRRRRS